MTAARRAHGRDRHEPRSTSPRMPKTGKPMSVRMTNCGPLGWVTDEPRLPLSAPPSRNRRAMAADPRHRAARLARACRLPASAGGVPGELLCARPPAWACTRTATSRTSPRPWCRFRSATPACFASAGEARRSDPSRCGSPPAMPWCSAGKPARLSRRRPHPARHVDAAVLLRATRFGGRVDPAKHLRSRGGRWPDQSDLAARDPSGVTRSRSSVPVPTFVSLCSTRSYERRNQRDTSNHMILVWLWI